MAKRNRLLRAPATPAVNLTRASGVLARSSVGEETPPLDVPVPVVRASGTPEPLTAERAALLRMRVLRQCVNVDVKTFVYWGELRACERPEALCCLPIMHGQLIRPIDQSLWIIGFD